MTTEGGPAALPDAFFHDDTGAVRFWVRTPGGASVGASISKQVLHYRFGAALDGDDAMKTYQAHRREIDAAALARAAAGSLEPVLLREADFGTR